MVAAASSGDHLTFTFTLPNGPNTAVVFVVGGADADADGDVNTEEVAAFKSNGNNVWIREQDIQGPTIGTSFAISYTVGSGVLVRIEITNQANQVVFAAEETTVFAQQTIGGTLS